MIKIGLFSFSLLFFIACNDAEPVATSYKKTLGTGAPATTPTPGSGTPTTPGTGDAAALKAQGTTLYTAKCQSCHQPLATTQKPNKTSAQIGGAATTIDAHKTSGYPTTEAEYKALEAALKK